MTITGITWNTEAVMAEYRRLKAGGKSGLEASRELRGPHWHQLGSRCRECGHLTIPARFYERNDKTELTHEQAEANYLGWLGSDEKPAYVNPPVMAELSPLNVPTSNVPVGDVPTCKGCGERPAERGRSMCSACRKAAYRGRRG